MRARLRKLRRTIAIVSIAALAIVPGTGVAAADTAVATPALPPGLNLTSELDPQLIAELSEIEERVLQEVQQGQQLQQQGQSNQAQIQANNQEATSVEQKVSDWNEQADALNEQFAALGERIDAHNAEPNTFELPDQAAEADAYQAEADELQSEQNQLDSQRNDLNQQQSAISAEQSQVDNTAATLNSQKQQLDEQISAFDTETEQLQSQVQSLLLQVVSALQAAEVAQQEASTEGDQAAGGDEGRPSAASVDDGQAGDDGGDPSSPKATDNALNNYAEGNDVSVDEQPVRALLTPGTVARLSPGEATGLSPYQTYDGLVENPDTGSLTNPTRTYTALEVVAPGAKPDPFSKAINQGGQATVEVGGKTLTITKVEMVPGGRPSPKPPSVPALDPATVALLQDHGQFEQPGHQSAPGEDPVPYGAQLLRPLPGENAPDPNNKPRDHPGRCTENWVDLGPLQTVSFNGTTGQRATGAEACVVSTNPAPRAKLGFGLFGLDTTKGLSRCHLIGHELNGSDSDLRNFVPCYQNPTNSSWMYWSFEYRISLQVNSGDPVYVVVRPIYRDQNPLPIGIVGFAFSNKGWQCTTFIPNVSPAQASSVADLFEGC